MDQQDKQTSQANLQSQPQPQKQARLEQQPQPQPQPQKQSLKQRVYASLEEPLSASPVGKVMGIALIILIVLNALLVGVPDQDPGSRIDIAILVFSAISTLAFALEYVCRIWIADLVYPYLAPARARMRYVCSIMGIIDFLSFFPTLFLFFLPASTAVNDAVRIIRLVRLIKISRYMRGLRSISQVFVKRRQEIVAAFMVLALLAIASSVLMYEAEHTAQPEVFDSVLTGLYWAITTMTTTGYGDIVPITPLGRFIGFVVMVISIGAVAIPAGIFSAGFIEEFHREDDAPQDNNLAHDNTAARKNNTVSQDNNLVASAYAKADTRTGEKAAGDGSD